MRRKGSIVFLSLLLASALFGACADQRTPIGAPHPHGAKWLVRTAENFHGTSDLACAQCHDLDDKCFQCHFGPDGAKVPAGVDWEHGTFIGHHQDELREVGATCDNCHSLTRKYRDDPDTCHECHEAPPVPHALDQAWFIPDGGPFHGTTTEPDCSLCHDPLDAFCVTCHFANDGSRVPPGVDWTHGVPSHAGSTPDLKSFKGVCARCHTITKEFTGQPSRTGDDCVDCHGFDMHEMPYVAAHQPAALANLLSCRQCHDTPADLPNFDGFVSGVACATCHPDAKAHPMPWYEGHRAVGANWPTACAICHNTQSATPATGPFPGAPSCFSSSFDGRGCHAGGPGTAPHVLGQPWLDPTQTATFHGTHLDLFPCQDCHDRNTFCSTCHFGPDGSKVPPGVTWTHGRYPHDLDALVSQQAVCNQCHTLMKGFTGSPTRTNCANCHDITIPHGAAFQTAHQTTSGMDLALCQRCHGRPDTTLFAGGVVPTPPNCTGCHPAARAHPVPWRLAAGATVSHKDAGNIPTACAICHDTVIGGTGTTPLAGAPPCRDCHPNGFVPHAVPFTAPDLHGPPAKANLNFCQTCHSDNPAGGPGSNPRFNVAPPDPNGCETCHTPGSAHATNWQGQNGTRSHRTAGSLPAACNICHGADLTGSSAAGVTRPSCSSSSFTNADGSTTACHFGGYQSLRPFHPPQATWLDAHQPLANATCTAECHAANGTTTVNGIPGCGVCHFGPTGSRVPAGQTWVHGTIPHDFLIDFRAVCNQCHTLLNATTVNCTTTCHAGASHPLGQPWLDIKSPTFHGIAASADVTSCQPCHGADYRGGTAGVSCYTCHFSPQGWKSPTGPNHVGTSSSTHENFKSAANTPVCNACHNTNRTYGNEPGSCHDCH